MSRISAGSTNRSATGTGICMITKAATSLVAGLHRLGGDHGVGALPPPASAMVSTALPSRSDFTASSRMLMATPVSLSDGLAVMSLR